MAKLSQLFDMQKIVENKDLSALIDETHNRYSDVIELSDEMLELAVAGRNSSDDDLMRVTCESCGYTFMVKASAKNVKCSICNELVRRFS